MNLEKRKSIASGTLKEKQVFQPLELALSFTKFMAYPEPTVHCYQILISFESISVKKSIDLSLKPSCFFFVSEY